MSRKRRGAEFIFYLFILAITLSSINFLLLDREGGYDEDGLNNAGRRMLEGTSPSGCRATQFDVVFVFIPKFSFLFNLNIIFSGYIYLTNNLRSHLIGGVQGCPHFLIFIYFINAGHLPAFFYW